MNVRHLIAAISISLFLVAGSSPALAQYNDDYARIEDEVQDLRGLTLDKPIKLTYKSRAELRDELDRQLADYSKTDQQTDLQVLVTFGFVGPGTDLRQLQLDLNSGSIAGYYDPETNEMVLVRDENGPELSASDEITFAHESTHALQNQHFDLLTFSERYEDNDDMYLASNALVEGDATLVEIRYASDKPELIDRYQQELESFDFSAMDNAPLFFQNTLYFPYNQGFDFTLAIWKDGGNDALNKAYQNPPITTEQILHPDKYLGGEGPMDVGLIDPTGYLGEGWKMLDDNVNGEFVTQTFLQNSGASERDAKRAAAGWGGDHYMVVGKGDETALIWSSEWDSQDESDEFYSTLAHAEGERLGGDSATKGDVTTITGDEWTARAEQHGTRVDYYIARNADTLDKLLASHQQPVTPEASPPATPRATPISESRARWNIPEAICSAIIPRP